MSYNLSEWYFPQFNSSLSRERYPFGVKPEAVNVVIQALTPQVPLVHNFFRHQSSVQVAHGHVRHFREEHTHMQGGIRAQLLALTAYQNVKNKPERASGIAAVWGWLPSDTQLVLFSGLNWVSALTSYGTQNLNYGWRPISLQHDYEAVTCLTEVVEKEFISTMRPRGYTLEQRVQWPPSPKVTSPQDATLWAVYRQS